MAMDNLDTLVLTIEGNSASAQKGVAQLARSLTYLAGVVGKPVGGLKMLNAEISTLKELTNSFRDGSGLAKMMNAMKGNNASGIRRTADGARTAAEEITNAAQQATNITSGFNDVAPAVQHATEGVKELRNEIGKTSDAVREGATQSTGDIESLIRSQQELKEQQAEMTRKNREWAAEQRASRGGAPVPSRMAEFGPAPTEFQKMYGARGPGGMALRGEFGQTQQNAAIESTAHALNVSIDEVKQKIADLQNAAQSATNTMQDMQGAFANGGMHNIASDISNGARAMKVLARATDGVRGSIKGLESGVKSTIGGLETMWKRVSRIASTMVIREGIRALMKSFKEAWGNAYEFSKHMGGEFYKSVDKARRLMQNMSVSLVKVLAPAMQAIVPVITVIAAAVEYLCNAVISLMNLLGITSDLFGQGSDAITEYGESVGGSGGKIKDVLAGFDELNVLNSSSGGGGGGGGGGSPFAGVSDKIKEELAALKVIIGESLLAIGLILAFTGHVGAGLGLMVLGAASIASVLTADWNSLPPKIQGVIDAIMVIAGSAFLAVGMILACTGHLPAGIALIALGAANLVAATAVQWGGLEDPLKQQLSALETIIGGASLALGAILAFTGNVPVGIALMVAGAAGLAGSATVAWSNTLNDELQAKLVVITETVGAASLALGAILAFSGNLPVGIALMGVGAAGMVTAASLAWTSLSDKVKGQFTAVATVAGGSLLAMGAILAFSGVAIPLGIAMMAAGGASLVSAVALNWGSIETNLKNAFGTAATWLVGKWNEISTATSDAWNAVKTWWTENVYTKVTNAWKESKTYLTGFWNSIQANATNAWNGIKTWWTENVYGNITNAWKETKTYLSGVWNSIQVNSVNAWGSVKGWWTENVYNKVTEAWKNVKTYLTGIWNSVQTNSVNAWNDVKKWWTENVYKNITGVWKNIKTFLSGIWSSVQSNSVNAWDSVCKWWDTNVYKKMTDAWKTTKTFLTGMWSSVSSNASDAWNSVKKWWTENVYKKITDAWKSLKTFLPGVWSSVAANVTNAWNAIKDWWNATTSGPVGKIKSAWTELKDWFKTNITDPIANAFKGAINRIIGFINLVINGLNKLGNFTIPGINIQLPFGLGTVTILQKKDVSLWNIGKIPLLANGAYGVPNGDLFIANEAGPELVGQMNGKTTVANQEQIIEGIRRGVRDATADQNELLRQQNALLLRILQKDNSLKPSSALGGVVNRSLEMYGAVAGG